MPSPTVRVLLLENEAFWADMMAGVVETLGWDLVRCETLDAAQASLLESSVDIVVLDRILDRGEDGLALVDHLRAYELTANVLVVSQLSSTHEKVHGLTEGADDYLPKPFDEAELRARLVALARRRDKWSPYPTVFLSGPLEIRYKARTVSHEGRPIRLPGQQFDLLWAFVQNAGEVLSREFLWREVWPQYARIPHQDRVIETAVSRLRATLSAETGLDHLKTVRGVGYRWGPG